MVDIVPIATVAGVIITVVGGIFTLKEQVRKSREDTIKKNEEHKQDIITSFKKEIEPLKISLEKDNKAIYSNLDVKEQNINDLWKDVEHLEDHLNVLEKDVSRHSGVIDIQTPLIMEVKTQILALKEKIDLLTREAIK